VSRLWHGRRDFEKAIVKEETDGLTLLIVVGACSALVAALRKRAEIVLPPAALRAVPPSPRGRPFGPVSRGGDLSGKIAHQAGPQDRNSAGSAATDSDQRALPAAGLTPAAFQAIIAKESCIA
jgi:hypothetical protein